MWIISTIIDDLCESPLIGYSEGTERPKNLIATRKYEILHYAQDDKQPFCRGLKPVKHGQVARVADWPYSRSPGHGAEAIQYRRMDRKFR
jgi:hypothetical protein